jgi:hypothetical protein
LGIVVVVAARANAAQQHRASVQAFRTIDLRNMIK